MAPSFARVGNEVNYKLSGPKYDTVPATLCHKVREAFDTARSIYSTAALETPAESYRTQYEVKKGTLFRSANRDTEFVTIATTFSFAETANIALIDHIVDKDTIDFTDLTAVELESDFELANPAFLDQHQVQRGVLSWGHDTFGCLSLCWLGSDEVEVITYFVQQVSGNGEAASRSNTNSLSNVHRLRTERPSLKFSMKLPGHQDKNRSSLEDEADEDVIGAMAKKGHKDDAEMEDAVDSVAAHARAIIMSKKNERNRFQGERY